MLARGKGMILKSDLEKLLNLPEGVEVVGVSMSDNEFEFALVSPEPVEGVTRKINKDEFVGVLRRVRVPRP